MPLKSQLGDRVYYFLPHRVALVFGVVEVIAKEGNPTTTKITEITKYSRAYISACLVELKRHSVITTKKNEHSLVKNIDETTVGEILEAASRDEDRSELLKMIHDLLIGKAKELSLRELIYGKY